MTVSVPLPRGPRVTPDGARACTGCSSHGANIAAARERGDMRAIRRHAESLYDHCRAAHPDHPLVAPG
ncbi:hypothetical protein M1P56_11395 [Streptomyces sp. HU2014]|uniref:hypothetical protein n=1 Tax=Streptomyces sp. HU2014 TaxID=2939414 RepID=UPI002010896B|nr:hypothetical protein [Streptomyces sp. HU2014]UQI44913.1 hypothetical protein M1P56_11395 [Streptomyces sp. HU2014]